MRSWRDFIRTLAVFVALTAGAVAVGAQGRNAINGMVVNTGREPINRIRVELQNELEMFITYTYTDAAGRYSFRNLSQGVFIVKVHSDGKHTSQSTRIVLQALRNSGASHYEQVDFMLKEIAERKPVTSAGTAGTLFAQDIPDKARKIYDRAVKQLDSAQEKSAGIASLKEALQAFPRYYDALERLGIEYVRLQQYEEARQTLTLAVEVNRGGAASFYGLGVAQFHTQRTSEAVESLQKR
jgi:tetratricopeptide (TPR) repeat protein